MIKNKIKYLLIILIAIIASFLAIRTTKFYIFSLSLFLDKLLITFFYTVSVLLGLIVIYYSLQSYYRTHNKKYLLPLLIIFLSLISVTIILLKNRNVDKSRVIMCAKHSEDIAGNILMEFREDHTYKIDYYNSLYGDIYRGTFHIKCDTIFLDPNNPIKEETHISNILIIKNDTILYYRSKNNKFDESYFMKVKILEPNKFLLFIDNEK